MISVRHVSKTIAGTPVLDDISFTVPEGAIYGLIGPENAGKTLCLMMLATLIEPDSGRVVIHERIVANHIRETREIIGYVPEIDILPTDHSHENVATTLAFHAACRKIDKRLRHRRIEEVLERLGMAGWEDRSLADLSPAGRYRLALASVLLHAPLVLLLDNPLAGLDSPTCDDLMHHLRNLAREGMTIVLSSGTLHRMDRLCTHMGILHQGRILRTGTTEENLAAVRGRRQWHVRLNGEPGRVLRELASREDILALSIQEDGLHITMRPPLPSLEQPAENFPAEILSRIAAYGIEVVSVTDESDEAERSFTTLLRELLAESRR